MKSKKRYQMEVSYYACKEEPIFAMMKDNEKNEIVQFFHVKDSVFYVIGIINNLNYETGVFDLQETNPDMAYFTNIYKKILSEGKVYYLDPIGDDCERDYE